MKERCNARARAQTISYTVYSRGVETVESALETIAELLCSFLLYFTVNPSRLCCAVLLSRLHLWWNSTRPVPPQLLHGLGTVYSYNSWRACLHRAAVKVASKLLSCLSDSVSPVASSFPLPGLKVISTSTFFFFFFPSQNPAVSKKEKRKHWCHNSMLIRSDIYLMWKQIVKRWEFAARRSIAAARLHG